MNLNVDNWIVLGIFDEKKSLMDVKIYVYLYFADSLLNIKSFISLVL